MNHKGATFSNVVGSVSTSTVLTIPLAATSSTEQAYINTVEFKVTDPLYPVTVQVKLGDKVFVTKTATAGADAEATLVPTDRKPQLVDISSSFNFVVDTGDDKKYAGKTRAMLFNSGTAGRYITDTEVGNRADSDQIYSEVVDDLLATTVTFAAAAPAQSAFGWLDGITEKFSVCDTSHTVETYGNDGTLLQTATAFTAATHGACTDGTYFYGKSTSNNAALERRLVSDGSSVANITLDTNVVGQSANTGGFTLYYEGHIYILTAGGTGSVKKINVSTGAVTSITVPSIGSYCAGAIVTETIEGTPVIIAVGTSANDAFILDLTTETYTEPTHGSLGTSTEYGSLAIEIAPGVGLFFYNNSMIWIDANLGEGSPSTISATSAISGMLQPSSNSNAASIANIPFHDQVRTVKPRAITYDLYCDGVLVTGVE